MNRIDRSFADCAEEERKALVVFITAGDPDLATTEALIPALAGAGADVIELGIPFSDPMADGPTIQEAGRRALDAGTTLPKVLEVVRRCRALTDVPVVLFSYYNVLMQYGVSRLAEDAAEAGVDGWLVVDVPFEEAHEVRPLLQEHGLQWITLVAPTTPPRRTQSLLNQAEGFVYCITVTGVTGARNGLPPDLKEYLDRVRGVSRVPVVAGFGISTPDMAATVAKDIDGVVVGSALIREIAAAETREEAVAAGCAFVSGLARALR